MKANPLLTTTQAAQRLGISVQAIRQACAAGKLPARKLGNGWVVKQKDVEAYRERRQSCSAG